MYEKRYFSQIYQECGIKSKNNLLKNLNILTKFKIIKKDVGKGNTFYAINYESSLAVSLLNLINYIKFESLDFERKEAVKEAVKEAKPAMAVLFGSSAKGDFKKQSDIDLLLVYDKKFKMESKTNRIKQISSRYGMKINPVIISFSEINLFDPAIKHIFKTGYPLTGEIYFYEAIKNV